MGVLLDTNVLLLLLVGYYDPNYIEQVKRIRKFTKDDYFLLAWLVKLFPKLVVTPQILAEISNFLDLSKKLSKEQFLIFIQLFIEKIRDTKEIYKEKNDMVIHNLLPTLGFTDVSISMLAEKKRCLVITADGPLAQRIREKGSDVINFEEIRIKL